MFSFHGQSFNLNIYIFQTSNTIENVKFEPNKLTILQQKKYIKI